MTYSFTQIAQYLRCPRAYRYRYLDGWREKETRAALVFGRCFENALGAFSRREDSAVALYNEWVTYHVAPLVYTNGDDWDRLLRQGIGMLESFARDDRVRVHHPARNLQIRVVRQLPNKNEFVAYVDATGELDGSRRLLEWKTTTCRYSEDPAGLLALDPQLICYSWMTGIAEVAVVVFVRKRIPEVQYLTATISEHQRKEFGELVEETIGRIETSHFHPHSGIRFPQNICPTCPQLGHCIGRQDLVDAKLVRRAGAADFDWIDQLEG